MCLASKSASNKCSMLFLATRKHRNLWDVGVGCSNPLLRELCRHEELAPGQPHVLNPASELGFSG